MTRVRRGFHPVCMRVLALAGLIAVALVPGGCGKRGAPLSPSAAAAKAAPKPAGPLNQADGYQSLPPSQRGATGLIPPGPY